MLQPREGAQGVQHGCQRQTGGLAERERSQVIASRLVRGLFDTQPNTEAAEAWLASHPDAPGALRRIVVEEVDQLQRRRRAQAVSDGSRP